MSKEEFNGGDFIPMELRSGMETLKNMPNRLITLLWKLIGWKGVMVALTVYMIMLGKLDSYVWVVVFVLVIFDRAGLDFIKEIKK
jgi:hypothetical protein